MPVDAVSVLCGAAIVLSLVPDPSALLQCVQPVVPDDLIETTMSIPNAICLPAVQVTWNESPAGQHMDAQEDRQSWRDALIEAAESQLGVSYWSLHYGPDGDPYGNGEGFGCAMFVSYAYNNTFFGGARADRPGNGPKYEDGFAGWTQAYWANCTGDAGLGVNPGFHEVDADEAKPGDVICFLDYADAYSSPDYCYHVGMYHGDGKVIDSSYAGVTVRDIDMSDPTLHFLSFDGSDAVREWEARRTD